MADFLLELRSEEIPARMQTRARNDLARLFAACTGEAGLTTDAIDTFSTPRRLVLIARDVAEATEASSEEVKGPRASAPAPALDGFLKKTGLARDQLEERDGVFFAVIERAGRPAAEILADTIKRIVTDFPWPKSMRWGGGDLRWVRPLQGLVALLGEDIVPVEIGGIASGATTVGHRFHHPGDITVGGASDYVEKLRACHVIVDHEERERAIREGAAAAARDAGLTLLADEGLVVENAGLTEWPVPIIGRFDPEFLDVPREAIVLTMRTNQKYFACTNEQGLLAPAFVCVANVAANDGGEAIAQGNARVLAARLADARFFWEQDLKVPLESQAKKLDGIIFHEKLGTVADKVERVARLARWLVEQEIVTPSSRHSRESGNPAVLEGSGTPASAGVTKEELADQVERAARLAKADLVTGMVGEFPELQGVIGGYLAEAQGEPKAVADAIRDHYKPVGQGDEVPTAPVTVAVALADKLDNLVSFFCVKERPTGSKDPFALRRAALGVLRLIFESAIRLELREAILETRRGLITSLGKRRDLIELDYDNYDKPYPVIEYDQLYRSPLPLAVVDELPPPESFELSGTVTMPAYSFDELYESGSIKYEILDIESGVYDVLHFLLDRLEEAYKRESIRSDLIRAVIPKEEKAIDIRAISLGDSPAPKPRKKGEGVHRIRKVDPRIPDDPTTIVNKIIALQQFVETAEGTDLLVAYKRAANILKKEGWTGPQVLSSPQEQGVPQTGEEDPLVLVEEPGLKEAVAEIVSGHAGADLPQEKALIAALDTAEPKASAAVEQEDFTAAMAALASLRTPIDDFFDHVTVNDADAAKRERRLNLLMRFRDAVNRVADFSKIEG